MAIVGLADKAVGESRERVRPRWLDRAGLAAEADSDQSGTGRSAGARISTFRSLSAFLSPSAHSTTRLPITLCLASCRFTAPSSQSPGSRRRPWRPSSAIEPDCPRGAEVAWASDLSIIAALT